MISGKASFICSNKDCDENFVVNGSDFDVQNTWTDEDRGMGAEEGYEGTLNVTCPKCGEEIEVTFEFTEYPVGAPNYEDGPKFDKEVSDVKSTLSIFG